MTTQYRLPAPKELRAIPRTEGGIEITWAPVLGATKYQIIRSAPPDGPQVLPDTAETMLIDRFVQGGRTYYYLVAAYNESGTLGLKAGTGAVTAPTFGSNPLPWAAGLKAQLTAPNRVHLTWTTSPAFAVVVNLLRVVYTTTGPQATIIARVPLSSASFDDTYDPSDISRMNYVLRTDGGITLAASETLTIAPDSGATATTDTSGSGSATSSTATTTVTVAAPVSLRVGVVQSLSSVGGAGARWLSMNESVATVDAAGSVSARSAGNTQVVALTSGADGSLRIANVRVTVAP